VFSPLTANDNASLNDSETNVDAPEPCWEGPGDILALGTRDGRYALGLVRATGGAEAGRAAGALDAVILFRLLAHYGAWLGFDGQVERVQPGRRRQVPVPVGPRTRVEYRLDLRRISRRSQTLAADGVILLNGFPAVTLDDFAITFQASGHDAAPVR